MNEAIGVLLAIGLFMMIGGLFMAWAGCLDNNERIVLTGFLVMALGVVMFLHPFWGAWWLFLQNLASSVPTWVWVVAGVIIYFTLNHTYAAWLIYANNHQNSWAAKILEPWPLGNNIINLDDEFELALVRVFGVVRLAILWLVTIISYAAWLIFGGGIAKLLHLVPRE